MFDRLSNDEITNALNESISCFGVKEDMPSNALVDLLRKKNTEECVQEIATRLSLPIRISLSYVPKDFRPDNTDGFRSSELSRTDWTGRGIEGITAQVSIPQNLPMFGTADLQGYPIKVRVSENCHAHPDAFVAIMAHELSHVLLASLMSPHKDSELHTDLVPILLGFRDAIRRGRKRIENTTSGNTTTTRTTTYGYLTDSQFEFACSHVSHIIEGHQRDKENLIEVVKQLQSKLKKATRSLVTFRDYFKYLDRRPPDKMRPEHAQRVVQLHAQDYSREWEARITEVRTRQKAAESFMRHLNHYTSSAIEHIKTHTQAVDLATAALGEVTKEITKDERILRKYVGIIYGLRRALLHHS
ncbi:MAG: hypothetical protein V1685_06990 [Parcubacteria group bacterium]